jgi:hypothetical protein
LLSGKIGSSSRWISGSLEGRGSYVARSRISEGNEILYCKDAGISILFTQEKLRSQLSTEVARVVCLDTRLVLKIAKQHTEQFEPEGELTKLPT